MMTFPTINTQKDQLPDAPTTLGSFWCGPDGEVDYEALQAVLEEGMRRPLPDGLAVLSLEFRACPWGKGYEARDDMGDPMNDAHEVFERLGSVFSFGEKEKTCFGGPPFKKPMNKVRIRVDIIAKEELLLTLLTILKINGSHSHFNSKIYNSLSHLSVEGEYRTVEYLNFRHNEVEKFRNFDDWIRASQINEQDVARISDVLAIAGGDVASAAASLRRSRRRVDTPSFLVPGLIPDGSPSLLLGSAKAGKSTALLELAVAVARREPEWMGFPIDHSRRGLVVFFAGEDSEAEVIDRVKRMTGDDETPHGLMIVPAGSGDLDEILGNLKRENVRLIIVDPARKYFVGDEDGSDPVSGFFNRIEPIAREKNCALVVAHHLKRHADPKTVSEIAEYVRGSGVWLDRPRVTIGMLRRGGETQVGISGSPDAPLHNFRRDTMFAGVRRLRRDDATSRHIPIDRPAATAPIATATGDQAAVLAAITDVETAGRKITRTGPSELYKHAPKQTNGWPRAKVRAAVEGLILAGQLRLEPDGSLTSARPAPAKEIAL
jgi:hypothetical protein